MVSCCVQILQFYLFYIGLDTVFQETLLVPKNPKVLEGSSLTLSCRHEGEPTSFSSTWSSTYKDLLILLLFDGYTDQCTVHTQNLPYNVNPKCSPDIFNLSLSPVLNDMHGSKWTCSQLFEKESVSSLYVEVPVKNVTMSLAGGKQPTILKCVENESLYLECNTSFGRPSPSITWLIGDSYSYANVVSTTENKLVSNNASDGTYNYTLTVLRLNVSRTLNNKRIFCNSTNLADVASVSSNFFLFDVHYPPTVEPIENDSITERNNFTKLCRTLAGNHSNTTVTWTREDNLVSAGEYLNISPVERNNEGYYTCSARNAMQFSNGSTVEGLGSKSFYLSVMYPPEEITVDLTKDIVRFHNIADKFNVIQGSIVTLGCTANSRPLPSSYTWSGILSASEEKITIHVTKNLSGNFICTARNIMTVIPENMSITGTRSKSYTMNVQYPPEIGIIENITVVEFRKVNYTCPVTRGNPAETKYFWTRSGDNKEWRSEELLIDPVSRNDEGFYILSVTNVMKPIYGSEEQGVSYMMLYMTVLYPPEGFSVEYSTANIRHEQIADTMKIIHGTYVTLSCSARSKPPPLSYVWSGDMTVYSANISFTATKSQSREYICSASNVMKEVPGDKTTGTNKKIYHIDVLYPPEVNHMQNMTAVEGTPFNLNCSVVYGNPYYTTMKWVRMKDNMTWYSRTLSIGNITRSDYSIYTCIANNTLSPTYGEQQIGLSSQTANIEVLYKCSLNHFAIEGYKTQNVVTVNESQRVSLLCSVDSNPKSFISISFDGNLLMERSGTNELVYSINRTKCTDAGTYVCHGNNWLNNRNDTPNTYLKVYVNCAPRQSSTIHPATNVTNVTSVQHVSTTLTFKALAYPTPSIHWYRKLNSSWIKLEIESSGKIEIVSSPVDFEYNLTLFNISKEDYGQYRLDINNSFGNHTQVFNLIPKDKPNPPNRFEFDEQYVTETSLSVWWEPGFDGGLPQTFLIQYREEKSAWFNYTTLEHMNQMKIHITVTGLKSGTQYHFKIIASNDLGSSTTKELFIRTKDTRMTSTVTVDNVGPTVGVAVGAVLAIVLSIIIGLIIRSRISRVARETPIYQNTSSLRDRLSSVHVSGSNHNETLQTRGSELQYQQLSSFARGSLTDQRKIYENLKLSRARENPDIEPPAGSPTTLTQSETQSVL